MPEFKLHTQIEFTMETCAKCGIVFALTTQFEGGRRNDHAGFFCPNGHALVFNAKNEAERLREELASARRDLGARLDAANARANEAAAELARVRQRVGRGACPCCKRSFTKLRRHMESKHPDYYKGEPPR